MVAWIEQRRPEETSGPSRNRLQLTRAWKPWFDLPESSRPPGSNNPGSLDLHYHFSEQELPEYTPKPLEKSLTFGRRRGLGRRIGHAPWWLPRPRQTLVLSRPSRQGRILVA